MGKLLFAPDGRKVAAERGAFHFFLGMDGPVTPRLHFLIAFSGVGVLFAQAMFIPSTGIDKADATVKRRAVP